MALLEVYSSCLKDKYKTTIFSKTTLFVLVMSTVKVIVPFFLAYKSKGLWLKRDVFYEQPDIKFRGEYIMLATTTDPSKPILCTTLPRYYNEVQEYDNCTSVKAREIDNNLDGKMDGFYFSTIVSKAEDTEIVFITLVMMIDYALHTVCPLHMQSVLVLQQNINPALTRLKVNTDVRLNQAAPLNCHYKMTNNHYNHSLISAKDWEGYDTTNILSTYSKRNLTTHLTNIFTSTTFDDQSRFILTLNVRYPEDAIYYRPGFWQVLKWAWIQYFSIYIIFAWFVGKIENYVFENRLMLFYIKPAIKEKMK